MSSDDLSRFAAGDSLGGGDSPDSFANSFPGSIVDGEAVLLDVFEPVRQGVGHLRDAGGVLSREVDPLEGVVDDVEELRGGWGGLDAVGHRGVRDVVEIFGVVL